MSDTLPLHIYDEMVDKARRAGTAVPDDHYGDDPAMAWLPQLLAGTAEALAPERPDQADASHAARVFDQPDGSRYERVPPNDLEAA